ncbi:MAG: OmpA family protein [Pseudomonadota bacterium]
MAYPANNVKNTNTSGRSRHTFWTWLVAAILAVYLFWQWQHGHGPADASICCAKAGSIDSTSNHSPVDFNFTASATEGYQATGDASKVAWAAKSAALNAWLKGGADWNVSGNASNVTLAGTVDSEEIKQAKGAEAQEFFGAGVTVNNSLLVKAAATTPATIVAPTVVKLYFDTAKASLPADAKQSLAPIVEWLKTNTSAKAVISGYHDSRGSVALNQELAKNRAKAVSKALEDAGIDDDRIELRKPESTTGLGDAAEARRVEVSVE